MSASLRGNSFARKYSGDEPPLRSELFSADQMKLHGKTLAASWGGREVELWELPESFLASWAFRMLLAGVLVGLIGFLVYSWRRPRKATATAPPVT